MSEAHDYFELERRGALGILWLKPSYGVALADTPYTHALLQAVEGLESASTSVLLVCVPHGNFEAQRMDRFWTAARHAPPDDALRAARYTHGFGLPKDVISVENGVVQLLHLLRRVEMFKVVAFEGDVDFDLLGLLLAFEARFCGKTTTFQNRMLDRGVTPGFGVLWYLAQHVGQARMLDLVLNRQSLSAEEARLLNLVMQTSDEGQTFEDAMRFAEDMARKPIGLLHGLVRAKGVLHADFETYLDKLGGGFTALPSP